MSEPEQQEMFENEDDKKQPAPDEDMQASVWDKLADAEIDAPTTIWVSEVSFPLFPDEDDTKKETANFVRETMASTSKANCLSRILSIVTHEDVLKRTGFSVEGKTDGMEIIKEFFNEESRNLYISLVPLV